MQYVNSIVEMSIVEERSSKKTNNFYTYVGHTSYIINHTNVYYILYIKQKSSDFHRFPFFSTFGGAAFYFAYKVIIHATVYPTV